MVQGEIIKIKAEIYDLICQQDEYVSAANTVQQEKNQKIQQLKDYQLPEKNSSPDDIIKLKAEIFDIMLKQEEYVSAANTLQQKKSEKLQQLNEQKNKPLQDIKQ